MTSQRTIRSGLYGNPHAADSLGNVEIGKNVGRKISYRFRARKSGSLTGVRVFLKSNDGAGGYSLGTGGQVTCELHANDPAGDLPAAPVLATVTYLTPNPTTSESGHLFTFAAPYTTVSGTLYHLVWYNQDADPVNNFVSINDMVMTTAIKPRVPWATDQDNAVIVWDSALTGRFWTVHGRHVPIYGLVYSDATQFGPGIVNVASGSELKNVGNANEIKETFTVTGGTRQFRYLNWWCYKLDTTTTQDLEVYHRDASFNVIAASRIAPDKMGITVGWSSAEFGTLGTLTNGSTYNAHARSFLSGSTAYKFFPTQDGSAQGYNTDLMFTDGLAYLSSDRGVTWTSMGVGRDWIFCYSMEPLA